MGRNIFTEQQFILVHRDTLEALCVDFECNEDNKYYLSPYLKQAHIFASVTQAVAMINHLLEKHLYITAPKLDIYDITPRYVISPYPER